MSALHNGGTPPADLEQFIRDGILKRTGRGVRALEVALSEDGVVVRGLTTSYYLKQIALKAVFDVAGLAGLAGVDCSIRVESCPAGTEEGAE
jgi:hypothetical protein